MGIAGASCARGIATFTDVTIRIGRTCKFGSLLADGRATGATLTTQFAIALTVPASDAVGLVRTGLIKRTTGRTNRTAGVVLLPQQRDVKFIGRAVDAWNITAHGFTRTVLALGVDGTGFALFNSVEAFPPD